MKLLIAQVRSIFNVQTEVILSQLERPGRFFEARLE